MSFDGSVKTPFYDPFQGFSDQEIRPTPWLPSLASSSVPLENPFSCLNHQNQPSTTPSDEAPLQSDEELLHFFSTQLIQQSDQGTLYPPLIERSPSPFLREENFPSNSSEHNQDLAVQMTETAQQPQPRDLPAPNDKRTLPSWSHEGPCSPDELKQIQISLIRTRLNKRELRGADLHHKHLKDLSRSRSASPYQMSGFPPPRKRSSPLSLTETFSDEPSVEKMF